MSFVLPIKRFTLASGYFSGVVKLFTDASPENEFLDEITGEYKFTLPKGRYINIKYQYDTRPLDLVSGIDEIIWILLAH